MTKKILFGLALVARCAVWNDVTLPSYADEIARDKPVAYVRFGQGEVGSHCSLSNPAMLKDDGPYPGARSVHIGEGESVACSPADAFAFPNGAPFTLETFIAPDATDTGDYRQMFDRMGGDSPATRLGYYAWLHRETKGWTLAFESYRGDGGLDWVGAAPWGEYAPGRWAHLAITRDSSGVLRLYLNGVLRDDKSAVSVPAASGLSLILGSNQARKCCSFLGSMADFAVFDRALSGEDIARHLRAIQ